MCSYPSNPNLSMHWGSHRKYQLTLPATYQKHSRAPFWLKLVYSSPETFVPIMDTKHAAPATMKLSGLVSSFSKVTGAKGGPFSYKKSSTTPPPKKKATIYIHLSFLDSAGSFFFVWFPKFVGYISLNTGSNISLATSGGLRWSPFLVGEWPWNPMNLIFEKNGCPP